MSKLVVIASKNQTKIEVAKRAFKAVYGNLEDFEFEPVSTESLGLAKQPFGDDMTRKCAMLRLQYIIGERKGADFFISQEGGVYEEPIYDGLKVRPLDSRFPHGVMRNRAWIYVSDGVDYSDECTGSFAIPFEIQKLIHLGMELSEAAKIVYPDIVGTIIHKLTDGYMDRVEYYLQAAVLALSALKNKSRYEIA